MLSIEPHGQRGSQRRARAGGTLCRCALRRADWPPVPRWGSAPQGAPHSFCAVGGLVPLGFLFFASAHPHLTCPPWGSVLPWLSPLARGPRQRAVPQTVYIYSICPAKPPVPHRVPGGLDRFRSKLRIDCTTTTGRQPRDPLWDVGQLPASVQLAAQHLISIAPALAGMRMRTFSDKLTGTVPSRACSFLF